MWLLTNEMQAARRRIRTSRSSNCSMTSSQRDFPVRGWVRSSESNSFNMCVLAMKPVNHWMEDQGMIEYVLMTGILNGF